MSPVTRRLLMRCRPRHQATCRTRHIKFSAIAPKPLPLLGGAQVRATAQQGGQPAARISVLRATRAKHSAGGMPDTAVVQRTRALDVADLSSPSGRPGAPRGPRTAGLLRFYRAQRGACAQQASIGPARSRTKACAQRARGRTYAPAPPSARPPGDLPPAEPPAGHPFPAPQGPSDPPNPLRHKAFGQAGSYSLRAPPARNAPFHTLETGPPAPLGAPWGPRRMFIPPPRNPALMRLSAPRGVVFSLRRPLVLHFCAAFRSIPPLF